jgi:hypothetical protein
VVFSYANDSGAVGSTLSSRPPLATLRRPAPALQGAFLGASRAPPVRDLAHAESLAKKTPRVHAKFSVTMTTKSVTPACV